MFQLELLIVLCPCRNSLFLLCTQLRRTQVSSFYCFHFLWYREWNQDLVFSRQVPHRWAPLLLSWFSRLAAKFVLFFPPVEIKSWKAAHFKVEREENKHYPAFVKSWLYVASCLSPKLPRNLRLTSQWLVNEDIVSVLSRERCFLCAELMPVALAFVLCLAVIFVDNKLSSCS